MRIGVEAATRAERTSLRSEAWPLEGRGILFKAVKAKPGDL